MLYGDDIIGMVHDACGFTNMGSLRHDEDMEEEPNDHAKNFYKLLQEADTNLYPNCQNMSKLSFIVKLLHLKCLNHWSDSSMDMLLKLFKEVLPEGALVPDSYYEARKIIHDLGLDYEKIDACKNDCILYWGKHKSSQFCHVCGLPRWRSKDKKIAHKVLRYFPLKPRLQRLYMAKSTAKEMRWHKEERIDDDVLRHPADSIAWKSFDEHHQEFSADLRNVRLGLASDGFQPYGNMSTSHSIWPVVLVPYNLPPWKCMKDPYFMMSLLIPGPKCPGNDIDVYLQPLIDELKELWENGVETYDAHTRSNFKMRAAILWTINDFPAYGNLSGWSTKGKFACPCCHKNTCCRSLRNKLCYMGHRRFLPTNHPWRRNRRAFDGEIENKSAPKFLTGDEALQQLESLGNVTFGKGQKRKRDRPVGHNWRKKSIFFQLPYWRTLLLRHNLDVMHIERNVSDNVIGTVMNMPGKTKDTLKSRLDLVDLGIREKLHPQTDGKNVNNILIPAASYALSSHEKSKFCNLLANLKVPDAFASNISRCVNIEEKRISGLKCHDHHILLQHILPIAIRGLLPKDFCEAINGLSNFFKSLCPKCLEVNELCELEEQIIITLCRLETIFPQAFFDVMIHLPVH